MPDLREMPLSALDILNALMGQAYIDLRLGGELGDVRATLDVKFELFGSWTHVANIQDATDVADALLQLAAHLLQVECPRCGVQALEDWEVWELVDDLDVEDLAAPDVFARVFDEASWNWHWPLCDYCDHMTSKDC